MIFHEVSHYRKIYDGDGHPIAYIQPDKKTRKKYHRIDKRVAYGLTDHEAKENRADIEDRLVRGGTVSLRTRDIWGVHSEQEQAEINEWLAALSTRQRRKFRRGR